MLELKNTALLRTQSYVNGQWIDADSGETFAVTNPATGEVITRIANLGPAETRRAIEAADKAWPAWRKATAKERANVLRRWFHLIVDNVDDLAKILTAEQGKPLTEAKTEILYGANYIEWFSEEAKRIYGDVIAPPSNDKRIVVIKQSVGVACSITPWNFPSAMIARKMAPALAAGCPFIAKPASETPLSALALAVLAEEAGIPAGIFNVVAGKSAREIGAEMTSNSLVRKFTFTGSTAVGRLLQTQCADTIKKTSMELGGNAPFIVFDDADIDEAVKGAIICKYRNAGQTCVCANRIFVQEGVYDEFVEKFTAATKALKVGNGTDPDTQVGPLITSKAIKGVQELVDDALQKGAKATIGGTPHGLGECFYAPTVLTEVNAQMRLFKEEIFGPVAPLFKFSSEDEVIRMANDTEFGLASYFYSRDIGRIWRVAEALEYGMVGINEGIISNEMAPFGGIKESGLGREGSKYGLDDYLEIKYLCMGGVN
ncbi:NAD-dependent succinate-semialdehyde dehydrogenase [Microbulbifer thermotolerans]|uniref:NAD-dependent succinate-semialdehyde dehydrogenase n=1 Tax=Microbulbifer thermotolerans TaxID=252514 RepID=A0A143HMX5_MICTH|nr:NAD-dependent succinate-semialdehyde dehydrogenase [Microbulbifer thermotolerans]AMX03084.1 NAD-dependent succinate-semialdehyde dehydrogenase [Microbulbifer thermotolerans]MCX2779050.1 NAD-dependent succinate-semialdehyde dehydrogenase [Microbulbifer thermotolerans]MCX2784373.1 NAD-dependent succinate-semialdehyde dehydrogenase [Microbulbifer thermotolerans]MCX2795995.1 NAD-dependent succinate-semialdehyde dehydrogenase [Microbulbifer thermotolerans]MCX2801884.1 NAD-dependent succinate-sem